MTDPRTLPEGAAEYLAQIDAVDLTTIAALTDALGSLQRIATTVSARLALELAELDGVHHAIVERVMIANEGVNRATGRVDDDAHLALRRQLGAQRAMETIVENAKQRSEFLKARLTDLSALISVTRRGVVDLQQSQAAFREHHEATMGG
jgi:hypothetical protein